MYGRIHFSFIHHQRRNPADDVAVAAAGEQEQVAGLAGIGDQGRFVRIRLTVRLGELHAHHQAQAAHVADDRVLGLQAAQIAHQLLAARGGVFYQFFFADDVDGGFGRHQRQGVATAVGAAVGARLPLLHQRLAGPDG